MNNIDYQNLIDLYIEAYNSFDISGMLELLTQDIQFENYSGNELTASSSGIDEFKNMAEFSGELFSEREQRIVSSEIGEDCANVEIEYRGKFAKDIPDGPKAGSLLELQGTSEFKFTGSKISKIVDRV